MTRIIAIILHRNFEKQYKTLDDSAKLAFRHRRNLLLLEPYHPLLNNHVLKGKWKKYRSINITGDIRAVYEMEGFIAIFHYIGSHSELYG